jgi:hypothetical protein
VRGRELIGIDWLAQFYDLFQLFLAQLEEVMLKFRIVKHSDLPLREPRHGLNSQYIVHAYRAGIDKAIAPSCRMVAMKPRLVVLLLCASLVPVCARAKTILPDACGDDGVKFEVSTLKNQPAPEPPPSGSAQIIFVEEQNARASFHLVTVRYGVDGNWAGANYGDSYFIVNVTPGVHHLCVNAQGDKKAVGVTSFTAEAGKVYYYEASTTVIRSGGGMVTTHGPGGTTSTGMAAGSINKVFQFTQLSEDEGKYRIKAWKLATWKTGK